MTLWLTLAVNSIALGGLLFLLSAGFSLIFGLMRIPNLLHGSFFMLGAYLGVSILDKGVSTQALAAIPNVGWIFRELPSITLVPAKPNFFVAALVSAAAVALIGGLIERFLLRRLEGQILPQVLLTLGLAFIVADLCLMIWTGDPWQPATPAELRGALQVTGLFFPIYRLAIVAVAVVVAIGLWFMVDWTRLGAMIRAGVDDAPIARVVGIRVTQLFTLVFSLGAGLAGFAGVMGAPYLSVYPGLDFEMLPLALIVVILGGSGSLIGAFVGSFVIGFLYNFGQALFPDLAYVILFLPMVLVLVLRPQGLFGRFVP
jgi:branched-chain amino acid transport system permease protein